MNAYACTECDWEYNWKMGDRVQAVKRHQLAHLLETHGWRKPVDRVVETLMMSAPDPDEIQRTQHSS